MNPVRRPVTLLAPMLFIFLAFTGIDLLAGLNSWTTNGPEGAAVTVIAIAPKETATVYAATGAGVFRSTDGGERWRAINNGLTTRLINDLAVDHHNADVAYAATNDGLFKTEDRGQSWRVLPALPSPVTALALDPTQLGTIYAIGAYSLYKSSDGGETWQGLLAESSVPNYRTGLAVHPSTGEVHTTFGGEVLMSSANGGATWTTRALPNSSSTDFLTLDPAAPTTIYVGGEKGLFKTVNEGQSWTALDSATLPYDEEMGMYFLSDLIVDPSSSSTLFIVANGQVCKSVNGGSVWTTFSTQATTYVSTLTMVPAVATTLYAGTSGDGVFKTLNGGSDWNRMGRGLKGAVVRALLRTNATEPSAILAGTAGGLHQSPDGGASWHRLNVPLDVEFLAVDPGDSETMYAGSRSRLLRTRDGGQTWSTLRDVRDFSDYLLTLVVDPANPATLYLGTGVAVFKSTDRGDTWAKVMRGLPTNVAAFSRIAIDPSGALYVATAVRKMFKSSNAGASWQAIGAGLPLQGGFDEVGLLEADPYDGSLYAAVRGRGLFKSVDGGATWQSIGLSNQTVTDLVIDLKSSSSYAATRSGGVFRSVDDEEHWTPMNDGLSNSAITSLALDARGRVLHAGTSGGGVFEYEISGSLEIAIEKLPDDPARLRRLLTAMASERSTMPGRSRKTFLISVSASAPGANGTFFRSDVTMINRSNHEQQVIVAWLSSGEESITTPAFRITLPASLEHNGWLASPPVTITDFVRQLGISGLGALLFVAVDGAGNLAGGDASIDGFSRVWSPAPDGRGTVSQSFAVVDPLALEGEPHALAVGFVQDGRFRTNFGVVNLDTTQRTFDCSIVGQTATTAMSITVPALSMKQIAVPQQTYGALAIEIWAEHNEEGVADFPWAAYGSSVDNTTGDSWSSPATPARP